MPVERLQALSSQLAALGLGLPREMDGRGIPTEQGAPSITAWLRDRYRLSPSAAGQQVRLATALDTQLSQAAAALAAGTINPEQAQLIAKTIPTLLQEHRAAGEKVLVEQCATSGPKELGRIAAHLLDRVASEIAEQRAAAQLARDERRAYEDRCLHLSDVHGGALVRLSGWLDRESAAVVRAAIDPLCALRPGNGEPDPRSPGQRRADALVDVCRLASACGDLPDNGGDRPQVTLTIDSDILREQTGTRPSRTGRAEPGRRALAGVRRADPAGGDGRRRSGPRPGPRAAPVHRPDPPSAGATGPRMRLPKL